MSNTLESIKYSIDKELRGNKDSNKLNTLIEEYSIVLKSLETELHMIKDMIQDQGSKQVFEDKLKYYHIEDHR